MQLTLKPEDQQFIEEQMKAGRFRSAEDVVSEALDRLRYDIEPTADDLVAAREGLDQLNRGEGIPWPVVRDRLLNGLDGPSR